MSTSRWTRVDAIFAGALTLPVSERDDFVRRACADDPELRREVDELLEAAESADTYFEGITPSAGLDRESLAPPPELEMGQEIGAYRLVRLLGRGGMGAVYLAERADGQFEQRVAIKIVQPSRVRGGDLIQRFLRERQILARLQHPHIARLYDGGVTPGGQPYLVMEYVEGEPITDYCDAHALSVAERVGLLRDVGLAVQHAHRNLIIHRDLKPSNILVTGDGEVKLLDFGIAKLLEEDPEVTATRTGGSLMTPAYAAPEQVRGGDVTTATDVYALGVLLYELLTGLRPHGAAGTTPNEMARAVLEETVPAPSTMLETLPPGAGEGEPASPDTVPSLGSVARARATRPERLWRLLSGDLDRICLMALRKEPERRYGSAQALVDDLQRHLDGHPVVARPDTLGYRARKFVSRHRAGVVAAAVVFVSLLGGLGAALWQAGIAGREAAKTREVSDFVLGLFEVSDPDAALGEDLSVRDLLLRGAERIDTELADQPDVQAEMYSVVGPIFTRLGLYDDARPLLEKAVDLLRAREGAASAAHAEAVHELGHLEQVAGNLERADSLYAAAIGWYERAPGAHRLEIGRVRQDQGQVAESLNQHGAADSLFRLARAGLVAGGAEPLGLLVLDLKHAEVLHVDGRTAAADSLYESIVERRADLPEERSLALAQTLMLIGQRASYGGDLDRAEPMIRNAIELRRTALGDRHRDVALGMTELAQVIWARGRREEALAMKREAIDILRETLGPENPDYAMQLGSLAVMVNWSGDVEQAVGLLEETERIQAETLGENHFHLAMTRRNLGRSLMSLGRYEEALPRLEAALRGWIAAQGDQEFFTGPARLDLVKTYAALGNRSAADSVLAAVMTRYREAPPQGAGLGDALLVEAGLHGSDGDLGEAVVLATRAIESYTDNGVDEAGLEMARARSALGGHLLDLERFDEAEPLLLEAHRALVDLRGAENRDALASSELLARLYRAWGRPEQAARFADTGGGS